MRSLAALLVLLLAVPCTACTTRIARLTVASTGPVEFSRPQEPAGRRTRESESRYWVFFIPFGGDPTVHRVLRRLIDRFHADYLRNVDIEVTNFSVILFSVRSISVEGEPWRARPLPFEEESDAQR